MKLKDIKNLKTKLIFLITTVIVGVILDQITKKIIVDNVTLYSNIDVIKGFFYITYTKNTGGAWSIAQDNVLLLAGLSIVALLILGYMLAKKEKGNLFFLSISLVVAGGFGNLIDRFSLNYVIDFLGFYIFGYSFPIFNVADILVVSGVIGLVLCTVIDEYREYKNKKANGIKKPVSNNKDDDDDE